MGITEWDLQPLKKVKVPPEYEHDASFYQEAIMKQHEKRRQRLLVEYEDLLNHQNTPHQAKSIPQSEKSEDLSHSKAQDKLQKIKFLHLEQHKQQLQQYNQKEQLIQTRRKQINSERELRQYQKEVLETSRLEQVQKNKQMLERLISEKQEQRKLSYDAKLQKYELYRQAQYMQPKNSRIDDTLARYQRSLEDKRIQDQQRLKRLEESLEKAQLKKSQNAIEIKRRGLLEQLKIEDAMFNREHSFNIRKGRLLEKLQLRTESLRQSDQQKQQKIKPYPYPKFLLTKQQKKLNAQTKDVFVQEICQMLESTDIHDVEDKLLQVCASQDKIQKDLYTKTNYLFLYH